MGEELDFKGGSRDDHAIRWPLVDSLRRQIAAGDYETPERLEAALERFLEREAAD